MELLESHGWPGDIRELANRLERAMITGSGDRLALDLLPTSAPDPSKPDDHDDTVLDETAMTDFERRNLARALVRTQGRIFGPSGAARLLGIKPTTLLSRLKKHGIDRT